MGNNFNVQNEERVEIEKKISENKKLIKATIIQGKLRVKASKLSISAHIFS